ncbi:beta-phosphoglucomutase [Prolixibacteraceae bacterium]|uniref:beta-phosphoglucomutase n=1 Tax=Halosquirtibacter xylanolyticus TaxID=3374599 RepID=UPI003749AA53|nr:beta-phosphoglucomutase [Prolixibacteraceae bacterium]QZT35978.1 beta-phosphoglucomutase [Prolixibacteraceae bacterium]
MVQIKACLFDLDGVIVDTAKYHYIAWKELANELGFDFTEDDNERLKGVSRMRSLDILLEIGNKTLTEEEKLHYAEKKNTNYVSYIQKMKEDEILPGVTTFLNILRENGIKIALGSASKNAPLILTQIGLTSYFDEIVDGNSVSKAKPDPEVFTKGASLLGVPAEECVVFEDAVAGIEAAKAGGMFCIGVGDQETLSEADFVIKGFEEMSLDRLKF